MIYWDNGNRKGCRGRGWQGRFSFPERDEPEARTQKDVREAGTEWKKAVWDESNATHLHMVTFCIEDDDDFIIFWKNLDKHE